ncbi:restriction endonuclease [Haloarcula sp. CBA1129]|uniref:restriction endonuclease n=1 Tax=Haloarcula sp. CBA1129 TaxID=1853684 RepID=UPI001CD9FAFA|nr:MULTISPECIES: restriction endonuclease [unclassified Haloarcula]
MHHGHEFQKWLNGPVDGGIRNSGGIRAIKNQTNGEREFFVFVSDSSASQNQNPWEDIINLEEGIARYWGDSKAKHSPNPDAAMGNLWVKTDYCHTYAQDNRSDAPPVLLFEMPESGKVTFKGLCILNDLRVERHKDEGKTVVNYLFDLAVLDTDSVSLEWIHRKARTGIDAGGPEVWDKWVEDGRVRRYSIWKDNIRTISSQQPTGRYQELLEDVRRKLDNPSKGKKLEILVKFLMEGMENFSEVELTPSTGDRGVDLTGRIELFTDPMLGEVDTRIDFKAQVKNRGDSISGVELSRLASRVDDGEIGLFFTTSHYTRQAQEENLSTYPVRLFSGMDLVEMLAQSDLTDGYRLSDSVVTEIQKSLS